MKLLCQLSLSGSFSSPLNGRRQAHAAGQVNNITVEITGAVVIFTARRWSPSLLTGAGGIRFKGMTTREKIFRLIPPLTEKQVA